MTGIVGDKVVEKRNLLLAARRGFPKRIRFH